MTETPKIAIITDWLTNMGGSERVILALHEAFPDAPIYTSVYTPENMPLFRNLDVRTSSLQDLPGPIKKLHKFFPTMRVKAFQKLDLSEFDVIISSTSAEAKQVKKSRPDQLHICYCYTPIRYYWSHYDEYKQSPGFGKLNWLIRLAIPFMVPAQRKADFRAAQEVDQFIAISTEVQARIKKYYKQPSTIIHPPVDFERFSDCSRPLSERSGYIALGRQVPYKRHDLAVQACTKLNLPLTVIGSGSEHERLKKLAGPTVKFVTDADDQRVAELMGSAKGFIFPNVEDYGIVQVEALAAGTPEIALAAGGALDIIQDEVSGVFFQYPTVESLCDALIRFETLTFKPQDLQRVAKRFHKTLFISKFRNVASKYF